MAEHAPVGTVGQTRGVIRRFGFVASAGTLAAELGQCDAGSRDVEASGEAHLAGKLASAPANYPKWSPKDRPRVHSVIAEMLNRDDTE